MRDGGAACPGLSLFRTFVRSGEKNAFGGEESARDGERCGMEE